MSQAGRPRGLRMAIVTMLVIVLSGCGPVGVEGWAVSCPALDVLDTSACESVASAALNNLGRGRPSEPQGVITVRERRACPEVPEWADPSRCWEAEIPLGPGMRPPCMVFARRPQLGGYGQVAGDQLSGLFLANPQPDCPVE